MKANVKLLAILLVLGISSISFISCDSQSSKPMPDFLLGEWKTNAKKFAGFSFVITKDILYFKDENAETEENSIKKIEGMTVGGDEMLYSFYCKNLKGTEILFSFYYQNGQRGTIRLKNQTRFLWNKVP